MKKLFLSLVAMMIATVSFAQIGYQVSLLDNATGEPQANKTVSCVVTLTNSEGGTIYSGTQTATSNEFGVLSLTVGTASMFKNMDWTKLPLYVSVTVDGKLIGKSQVLNVPVAEYAKKTGTLTYDNIGSKKVTCPAWGTVHFSGRTASVADYHGITYSGTFYIYGNTVFGVMDGPYKGQVFIGIYSEECDTIFVIVY